MPKSSYADTAILNLLLRATALTAPATVYVALFNGVPGGGGVEATGGSYARQAAAFAVPSANSTSNSAILTFTNMPAMTVNNVAICDALSGGNVLYYAAATAAKTTNAGDQVTIAAGGITVAEA